MVLVCVECESEEKEGGLGKLLGISLGGLYVWGSKGFFF